MIYAEFAKKLDAWLGALNDLSRDEASDNSLVPYLGRVEVYLDGELVGYLDNEIGGASWCYVPKEDV